MILTDPLPKTVRMETVLAVSLEVNSILKTDHANFFLVKLLTVSLPFALNLKLINAGFGQ